MKSVLSQKSRAYITTLCGVLSSPQVKHCLTYWTGLIWLVKFRSICEIACRFGHDKVDSLHHFIRNTPKKTKALQRASQAFIARELKGQDITLIIDDTPCERDGKKIEGLGIHHGPKGLVQGLCAVTAIIRSAGQSWAWAVEAYHPKKCLAQSLFRSKVQMALEILTEAQKLFQQPVTVLMDSWYTCAVILNTIIQAGWVFVGAIKTNRIIWVDGKKSLVRNLAKGLRAYQTIRISKKRVFQVAKRIVFLPRVGMVALFICKHHKTSRFFISNDLKLTCKQMVYLYNERFKIEFFHKDIKQHLGFGELFVRSRLSVQTHWTLVAIAYNIVMLSSKKRFRSFRQRINHLRNRVPQTALTRLSVT